MYVAYAEPVAAIRAAARRRAQQPSMVVRPFRFFASIWLRHQERQIERAVRELDHPELMADFLRASHHGR